MGRFRVSGFDIVGRAVGALKAREVGAAIARLSATYRAGRSDFDYRSAEGRAAYLWHVLPAHLCDISRLLQDQPELLEGRETLRFLALGAGPGSDVLALLDALIAIEGRGGLEGLARVEALRLDAASEWDTSFSALLPHALELYGTLSPGLASTWTFEAPARALRCDLRQPLSPEATRAIAAADLVLVANVLTELAPRGTDALPGGARPAFAAVLQALSPGATLLLVDRAGAPGAAGRAEEVVSLAREQDPDAELVPPRRRETRCGCALTRRAKEVYRHVKLPTTRDEDRPVKNCKTLWARVTRSRSTSSP